jgi:hypothetical protein
MEQKTINYIHKTPSLPFTSIILHCSATPDNKTGNNWEAIRKWHISNNGWDDIGYHFGIEYEGSEPTIKIGRALDKAGAHAKNYNHKAIGVCVIGNYDGLPPPLDIWDTTLELVRELKKRYKEAIILGHRETYCPKPALKTCPGSAFNLDKFRRELNA